MAVTLSAAGYFEADFFTDLAPIVTHDSSLAKVGNAYYVRCNGLWSPLNRNDPVKTIAIGQSPYTILDTDYAIHADATGGDLTINMPSVVNRNARTFSIKKTGSPSNKVTIVPSGAETIDAQATLVISTLYEAVILVAGTSGWGVI